MGLTSKGVLYSLVHHSSFAAVRSDIQVAAFDFAKGQFLSTPALAVQSFVGANNFLPGLLTGNPWLFCRSAAGSTR